MSPNYFQSLSCLHVTDFFPLRLFQLSKIPPEGHLCHLPYPQIIYGTLNPWVRSDSLRLSLRPETLGPVGWDRVSCLGFELVLSLTVGTRHQYSRYRSSLTFGTPWDVYKTWRILRRVLKTYWRGGGDVAVYPRQLDGWSVRRSPDDSTEDYVSFMSSDSVNTIYPYDLEVLVLTNFIP